jgi:hypothetical protein
MGPDYLQIDEGGGTVDKEQVLASFWSGERYWAEVRSDEHITSGSTATRPSSDAGGQGDTTARTLSTTRHVTFPCGSGAMDVGEW